MTHEAAAGDAADDEYMSYIARRQRSNARTCSSTESLDQSLHCSGDRSRDPSSPRWSPPQSQGSFPSTLGTETVGQDEGCKEEKAGVGAVGSEVEDETSGSETMEDALPWMVQVLKTCTYQERALLVQQLDLHRRHMSCVSDRETDTSQSAGKALNPTGLIFTSSEDGVVLSALPLP